MGAVGQRTRVEGKRAAGGQLAWDGPGEAQRGVLPGGSIGTQWPPAVSTGALATVAPSTESDVEYTPEPASVASKDTSTVPLRLPGAIRLPLTLLALGAVSSCSVTTIA